MTTRTTKTAAALKLSRTRKAKPQMEVAAPKEAAPAVAVSPSIASPPGKLGLLVGLLRREGGATLADLQAATGWQAHSVRGALAGSLKKKLSLPITSEKADGVRRYRIAS